MPYLRIARFFTDLTLHCIECERAAEMAEFTQMPVTSLEVGQFATGDAWCQLCWQTLRPYDRPAG
ncbi:MAG: hypothetical protein NVS3B17_23730 [Vulcanimicrobiaceae bacterium]